VFIFDYIYRGEGGSQKLTQIFYYKKMIVFREGCSQKMIQKISILLKYGAPPSI